MHHFQALKDLVPNHESRLQAEALTADSEEVLEARPEQVDDRVDYFGF